MAWIRKLSIGIMAFLVLIASVGCSKPEQVDEKDLSRWIVRFSSELQNDMENGVIEMSVKDLMDGWLDHALTISFQWKDEFIEIGDEDFEFAVLPDMELFYINDAGEWIANGALNEDKHYIVRGPKYKLEDGEYNSTSRVVLPGEYRIEYYVMRNEPQSNADPKKQVALFEIKIVIGNL